MPKDDAKDNSLPLLDFGTPAYVNQASAYKNFGPPPPNCTVTRRTSGELLYLEKPEFGASTEHPLSSDASDFGHKNFANEPGYNRRGIPGFFQPPFDYVAGEWKWSYMSSW